MTTEKQTKNTSTTDNIAIFGPLGKYAIIAVIMVSIIVTSAIMLEKQLNTIDQQVAEIEAEIAESNKKQLNASEETASTETNDNAISTEDAPQTVVVAVEAPAADTPVATEAENIAVTEETQKDSNMAVETTAAIKETSPEPTLVTSKAEEQTTQHSPVATAEQARADRQTRLADKNKAREEARQARIEAFKLDQKKHMTELFTRIKALEAKQLDRYKASQQNQVVSLREQIARQQKMIDELILRNKDLYELRSANTLRNQSNREQILNRI